jgi:hypothetical protein
MYDPGLNLHDWESEMASLEDDLHSDPAETLPDLDNLVRRMLEESGYDLGDTVAREGEEREVVVDYLAAHEIRMAVDAASDATSPGDVAAAVNAFLELFDYVVATRGAADADLADAEIDET